MPVSIILTMLVFSMLPAHSQDLSADELLGWFPPGGYQGFVHMERGVLTDEGMQRVIMRSMFSELRESMLWRLPIPRGSWDTVTIAFVRELDAFSNRSDDESSMFMFWDELLVIRGPGLKTAIDQVVEKGQAAEFSSRMKGFSCYALAGSERSADMYVAITPAGDLLVSGKRPWLHAMMRAGTAQTASAYDDPELVEAVTDRRRAAVWLVLTEGHLRSRQLRALRAENSPSERVDALLKRQEVEPAYIAVMIDGTDLVQYREEIHFASEEAAASVPEADVENSLGSPFPDVAYEERSFERERRRVILQYYYQLESIRQAYRLMDQEKRHQASEDQHRR